MWFPHCIYRVDRKYIKEIKPIFFKKTSYKYISTKIYGFQGKHNHKIAFANVVKIWQLCLPWKGASIDLFYLQLLSPVSSWGGGSIIINKRNVFHLFCLLNFFFALLSRKHWQPLSWKQKMRLLSFFVFRIISIFHSGCKLNLGEKSCTWFPWCIHYHFDGTYLPLNEANILANIVSNKLSDSE